MRAFAGVLTLWLAMTSCCLAAAARPRMIVGPEAGFSDEIARRIADQIARPGGIPLELVLTSGTPETIARIADGSGLQLAIVQDDALGAYRLAAERGHAGAASLVSSFRLIAPLHSEILFFIVRADSPYRSMHDIGDARINIGQQGSGSAMTIPYLYRLLFGRPLQDHQASQLPAEVALVRMLTDRSIDVVAFVGSAQTKVLADMRPEARKFVRLLAFDPSHPRASAALATYRSAMLSPSELPKLLLDDLPALSVRLSLIAADRGSEDNQWTRFAHAWCRGSDQLPAIATNAQDSERSGPWPPFDVFNRELKACRANTTQQPLPCWVEDRALGVCAR